MRTNEYADRDAFPWDEHNVDVYIKTGRVKWQGKVWQKHGECNRCGDCCKMQDYLSEEDWVKSYVADEERLKRGEHLPAHCGTEDAEDGWKWCDKLRKKEDGTYECAIWKELGFKRLPLICQIEPVDPRGGDWAKKYPRCSITFEDVTDRYL